MVDVELLEVGQGRDAAVRQGLDAVLLHVQRQQLGKKPQTDAAQGQNVVLGQVDLRDVGQVIQGLFHIDDVVGL